MSVYDFLVSDQSNYPKTVWERHENLMYCYGASAFIVSMIDWQLEVCNGYNRCNAYDVFDVLYRGVTEWRLEFKNDMDT